MKALLIFGTVESNDDRLIGELKHNVWGDLSCVWVALDCFGLVD
jgi:hypothetical protein